MPPLFFQIGLCGASLLLLAVALWRLRGTTLIAPITWSMGAVSSIGLAEGVLFFLPMPEVTSWQSLVRYTAATLTLVPAISILGAKRPQALVWNYIIASLWIVLVMPAAEVLLLKPQQTFEIYAFGPWMIAGLIFYSAIHYAGTRMTVSGLLIAAAQMLYLAPHLPFSPFESGEWGRLAASGMVLAAVVLGWAVAPRKGEDGFMLAWAQFKSAYGTAWALRIQQRLDELQVRHQWPVRLGWTGVEVVAAEVAPVELEQGRKSLARAFRSLLLRFWSAPQLEAFSRAELRKKPQQTVSTEDEV